METPAPLAAVLERRLAFAGISLRSQAGALRELHELFTRRRRDLDRLRYLDVPRYRLAYLRYHMPLNVARATCVLRDLLGRHPEIASLEAVADLGAGPGSASLATLLALPGNGPHRAILADRSRGALRLARELLLECSRAAGRDPPRVETHLLKLPALPDLPSRALVWLSLVLNELPPAGGRGGVDLSPLWRELAGRLRPPSTVLVVEPALRAPGLQLLALHDALVASGEWRVLGPCTHQMDCPLLAIPGRPWCHFHFRWQPGRLVEEIAAAAGLDASRGALSYLALERTGAPCPGTTGEARVVSDAMRLRGGGRGLYLCTGGERVELAHPPAGTRRGDRLRPGIPGGAEITARWPGWE